jgi:hypothetical protein
MHGRICIANGCNGCCCIANCCSTDDSSCSKQSVQYQPPHKRSMYVARLSIYNILTYIHMYVCKYVCTSRPSVYYMPSNVSNKNELNRGELYHSAHTKMRSPKYSLAGEIFFFSPAELSDRHTSSHEIIGTQSRSSSVALRLKR